MTKTYISSALRRLVYERAKGCCEYCFIPEAATLASHEVDHITARKHGGPTEADNLALCCTLCNKHKGSDLTSIDPETGEIVRLYHPRQDLWADHFQLIGTQFIPLTPTGHVTIRLLHFNRPDRIKERQLLMAAKMFSVPS